MRQSLVIVFILLFAMPQWAQHKAFTTNETLTYDACIAAYSNLDEKYDNARLKQIGNSDSGNPLYLFVINNDHVFEPEQFDREKPILFINNGIHPGEPDGIDACVMLCNELLDSKNALHALLDSIIICIIPVYNVDGALNRNEHSRANQNGPKSYGFRGSANYLDLNRDFIKCDSENAKCFAYAFTTLKPTVFVDTHVSNGADYPYTMTLITTQCDKLGYCGKFMKEVYEPALYQSMKSKGDAMTPYVDTYGATPETGLTAFLETPRFASGYAALFNTFGFISETHMLKPFPQRVESTYRFLVSLLEVTDAHAHDIVEEKAAAEKYMLDQTRMPLNYELDTSQKHNITFNGYTAVYKPSEFGTGDRLYYDRSKPWSREIPYYDVYQAKDEVTIPKAYIIPQAWKEVLDRLAYNNVQMHQLNEDTTIAVTSYVVETISPADNAYEGHYYHKDFELRIDTGIVRFQKGDYYISTFQVNKRFIVETLEPRAADSYFRWNFFDAVLQQKEWFSDYVFEDIAAQMLKEDASLKAAFDKALKEDSKLAANHWAQLYWIYLRSPYHEPNAFRIPVYRVE